jgi:hypothetical protein
MKMLDLTHIKPLKCEKKVSCKVNYRDLEDYIKSITGKRLEIPAILECGNDTSHDFDLGDHPEWLDKEEREEAEAFLFGDAKDIPTYHLETLMETMCHHKLLEPGNYTIWVSW